MQRTKTSVWWSWFVNLGQKRYRSVADLVWRATTRNTKWSERWCWWRWRKYYVAMWTASLLQYDQEERLGKLYGGERLQEDRLLSSSSRDHASSVDPAMELLLWPLQMQRKTRSGHRTFCRPSSSCRLLKADITPVLGMILLNCILILVLDKFTKKTITMLIRFKSSLSWYLVHFASTFTNSTKPLI